MEANGYFGRLGTRLSGQGSAGRRNSILVAATAAIAAALLIYVFVSHYRKSTVLPPAETTVFVAKRYIPGGMSEQQIISSGMLESKLVPVSQAIVGAISDPSVITGEVSTTAIAAGQQVTAADFTHGTSSVASLLSGDQRAVAIAIDAAHGLTGYLAEGDTVDVLTQGSGGTGVLFQNVLVLANQGGDVVLDLTDKQTLLLADALQMNLTLWLELRPATGATNSVKVGTVEKVQ
jgi:Flp pilus assembly protein CpaB